MGDGCEVLRRDFLVEDLRTVTAETGITGTIAVEAQRTWEETAWLSEVAQLDDLICGVVGWVPLTNPNVASELEKASLLPKMKGVRHPIHDESDDQFILREDFNRGVNELMRYNLRYDILIFEKHLPQTIQFIDRHPNQIFILDHMAKPRIRERLLAPWDHHIRELARRPNVYCKLSGIVTEADWKTWSEAALSPYFDVALQAFTPKRLMFGSDWPVITLASSYGRWADAVSAMTSHLSAEEREWVFAKTAIEAYGLDIR